ncbi:TetR/AcrR family transcriptional regulator [Methanoculleus frigidifontis]|nr:TetR/AcrR family transcriptional regulator [Methanoculleus sp. FWC-SCC1]
MADTGTSDDTREKILRSALRLFTTQGFHATPTAQISRGAGVSTGALFHHFTDKATLTSEVYLAIKREMAADLREGDDMALPVRKRITGGIRRYIEWGVSHPEERAFLNLFYHSPNICDAVKDRTYADFRWLHDLCAEAVAEGVIRDVPHPVLFTVIVRTADGIVDLAAAVPPGTAREEVVDAGLAVIWHGIGAEGPG